MAREQALAMGAPEPSTIVRRPAERDGPGRHLGVGGCTDRATGSAGDRRLTHLIGNDAELAVTETDHHEGAAGARDDQREQDLRRLLGRFELLAVDFDGATRIHRTGRRTGVTPRASPLHGRHRGHALRRGHPGPRVTLRRCPRSSTFTSTRPRPARGQRRVRSWSAGAKSSVRGRAPSTKSSTAEPVRTTPSPGATSLTAIGNGVWEATRT